MVGRSVYTLPPHRMCDRCTIGKTWEPACRNCGKYLCEVCFQYSKDKCCPDYDIPDKRNNSKRRIPDMVKSIK